LELKVLFITHEIENWKGKPKELVAYLAGNVKKDSALFPQLIELMQKGSDPERGTSADIIELISKENPEIVISYIDQMIPYINYKAPRVKWGIAETIANLPKQYPNEAEKAIPNLLKNTQDCGTVVRWSAAFALSEIAKNNLSARKMLVPKIQEIVKSEQNNGVRNVYMKALKIIEKCSV
jgi:hypothetical protein